MLMPGLIIIICLDKSGHLLTTKCCRSLDTFAWVMWYCYLDICLLQSDTVVWNGQTKWYCCLDICPGQSVTGVWTHLLCSKWCWCLDITFAWTKVYNVHWTHPLTTKLCWCLDLTFAWTKVYNVHWTMSSGHPLTTKWCWCLDGRRCKEFGWSRSIRHWNWASGPQTDVPN